MTKQRLNIELFKKVREKIAEAPTAYNQFTDARPDENAPCGTAACIGGWADILSAPTKVVRDARMRGDVDLNRAADALGLNGKDFWREWTSERARLFTAEPDLHWPAPFNEQWFNATTAESRAKVATSYLDHIIETGKVLE